MRCLVVEVLCSCRFFGFQYGVCLRRVILHGFVAIMVSCFGVLLLRSTAWTFCFVGID